jgi:hypothetical protein
MSKKITLSLGILAAFTLSANAALVWTVGMNDNDWPLTGTAGGAQTNFWQENGAINALPGSPNSPQVAQQSDNDYYFAGVYTSVIGTNGAYTPVGVVAANELGAERAFAGGDLELRYHFNLPDTFAAGDLLSVSFDANNLHEGTDVPDSRFGVEVYFNNVLVGTQVIIRPANLGTTYTTSPFSLASAGAVTGAGADNILSLKGISYNAEGGGNWMGVDYVQLDHTAIPEPSSTAMVFLAGMASLGFLGRKRSRK